MDNPHKASLVLLWDVYKVNKYAFSSLYVLHDSTIASIPICTPPKLLGWSGRYPLSPIDLETKDSGEKKAYFAAECHMQMAELLIKLSQGPERLFLSSLTTERILLE